MKLPQNYDLLETIDLKGDKKSNALVQAISIVLYVLLFIGGYFTKDLTFFAYLHFKYIIFNVLIAVIGSIVYIVLHELTHALFIKIFAPKSKVKFGFTAGMAFAASDECFKKLPYLVIALAPLVIWTLLLLIPCLLVPTIYFWGVYFVQMLNVAGAAGDLYVTIKILKAPKNCLIIDNGVSMEVYVSDVFKAELRAKAAKQNGEHFSPDPNDVFLDRIIGDNKTPNAENKDNFDLYGDTVPESETNSSDTSKQNKKTSDSSKTNKNTANASDVPSSGDENRPKTLNKQEANVGRNFPKTEERVATIKQDDDKN